MKDPLHNTDTTKMRTPKGPSINVAVSAEAIEHAMPRDSKHCMIADSVKAAFPSAKNVAVDLATIRFTDPERQLRYTYLTPRTAQVLLVKFDQGIKPEPFTFKLRQPHVTRSGSVTGRLSKLITPEEAEARKRRTEKAREALRASRITDRGNPEQVPERVGGRTAPLQRTKDNIPFSRRRAFGLRALEL